MPKIMKTVAVAAPVLTAVFAVLYQFFPFGAYLSLAITFGTIAYHFVMRLIVGLIYNVTMRNHANYNAAYFRQRGKEALSGASRQAVEGQNAHLFARKL